MLLHILITAVFFDWKCDINIAAITLTNYYCNIALYYYSILIYRAYQAYTTEEENQIILYISYKLHTRITHTIHCYK